ncbi:MAG TPA: protein kinase [Pyrinomonadaceae bacterium]|nr:protein kinase [Pyrinomonadaceae bacterium]
MRECPKCEICYGEEVQFCPQDQSQTRHTLPGTQLLARRYFIERRLGRGAMGQVYLARDENLGTRRVAVKTVRQDLLNSEDLQEGEAIVRFEREARSAASISHPHVVDVTDFGKTEDGVFYLVMEYVEGETLHRLLRREGTLTVKRAVNLLKQIAEGVEAAHDAGILHRDLKPANIFIMQKKTGKSEDGFIKVGDFGLAKIVNQTVTDTASNATPSSRGIIGTPEFMSPEQMQPELGVDVRADVYALGTIAYLMLGGRTPFAGDLMQLVMQKIMHTPPPLSSLRSDIPADVERAIMLALEREPAKRPANVGDWISELEKAAEDVSERKTTGKSRVVILAPVGSEVYVDDERHGTIGSTGRLILTGIPAGQHVLRVSKAGEKDDDRVIEIREDGNEQVIQAHLKSLQQGSQPSPSQGSGSVGEQSSILPGIVACTRCNSRYAEGVKFCGRCGNSAFTLVSPPEAAHSFPCPRCSSKLPPFSKFCGRCGLKMGQGQPGASASSQPISFISTFPSSIPKPVEKICQRCGGAFPPNIKFCGRCGASL